MGKIPERQPEDYPSPYFPDPENHKDGSVTFIWWGITPTGKRSKYFHQYRVFQRGVFDGIGLKKAAEIARERVNLPKLRRGYKWGPMMVQHNFLREKE